MPNTTNLTVRGKAVHFDEMGRADLGDIWRAAGFTKNQRPGDWIRLETTKRLVEAVVKSNTGKSRNWTKSDVSSALYTKVGSGGGTFADARLALAYAEYLNPKLGLEVREVFLRYKAADPVLADEILERASAEQNEWAGKRAMSRSIRKGFTAVLSQHGVTHPKDFAACTDATYQGLFDGTTKQLKVARGVTGSLRDSMNMRELAFIMASEALSSERIEDEQSNGPIQCRIATSKSARFIRSAIDADRKDRARGQDGLDF